MKNNNYFWLSCLLFFICTSCHRRVDTGKRDEPENLFPWNAYKQAVIFSFDYRGSPNQNFFEADPLNLLGKKWTGKVEQVKVIRQKILNEKEFISFRDSCNPRISQSSGSKVTDCGFKPHHAFCLADTAGIIRLYELVCFWCSEKRTYGYKSENINITGSYQSLYRFCQFNGFDYELDNPDALHSFATPEEIKCYQLRKTPEEVIHCDD